MSITEEEWEALLKQETSFTQDQIILIECGLKVENKILPESLEELQQSMVKDASFMKDLEVKQARLAAEELQLNEDEQLLGQFMTAYQNEQTRLEEEDRKIASHRKDLTYYQQLYMSGIIRRGDAALYGPEEDWVQRSYVDTEKDTAFLSLKNKNGRLFCEHAYPVSFI